MLRTVNTKQLQRIFRGEDLEFRITEYPVKFDGALILEDLLLPCDLKFNDSDLGHLVFKNCRFLGNISFNHSQMNLLSFEGCEFRDVDINECEIHELNLHDSTLVRRFHVGGSAINSLNVERNPIFEAIEVACENNILQACINDNGHSEQNSFKSTIYLCPERFDSMVLKNNISEILHIGTIGQYSSFEIDSYCANLFLFSNCNSNDSKVNFQNLQPLDPSAASVCIVNSERIVAMKQEGVFNDFKHIRKYVQEVEDLNQFRSLAS